LNRDSIIQHLTKVSYIKDTCRIAGHLSDDLFQHIWVRILEFDHVKLEQIYLKGYLQFYIYRMIVNEARNKNNPFLKNHKHIDLEFNFTDEYDKEQDNEFETNLKKVKSNLDKLFWYDKKIFELYVEFGSLRKVSAQTGIKYGAIHQTVRKVKKQLNENIISR
jgi:RNA polymerase sigma factor (sigma-70 family)